jgi:glyoxylate/hydroxypyruvate reductase
MAFLIAGSSRSERFAAEMRALDPDLDVRVAPDIGRAEDIEAALAWQPPPGLLASLPNLGLIVSVGAGVDGLMQDPTLPNVPLVRYVDPDLSGRMAAYIALQVLYHHRRMSEFRELQTRASWNYLPEPTAREVRVGLMGIGVLGGAAASVLKPFGYQLRGWSRTQKVLDGVACFSGAAELDTFLAGTDILAVLLPLTQETRGVLNRGLLGKLSRAGRSPWFPGPVLINAGRGGLQIDADILAALEARELYAASLDVFQTEPLPPASPLWRHPRVVITPHNAAESAPSAIARYALHQLRAYKSGAALENLVDRSLGY